MDKKQLEARLDYYLNIKLFGVGLKDEEEEDWLRVERELAMIYAQEKKEEDAKGKNRPTG